MGERVVLHVDMDAFYAGVEVRDSPSLRGVPLVVGSDPMQGRGRGVVCTASYEARAFGIHSAMPVSQAYRLAPHATFIRPDFARYKEASRAVMAVLSRYADALEVVGLDEAYLDVTRRVGPAGAPDWGLVASLARSLQAAVRRATGLSCSVGAAGSKAIAKVASDLHKPHGVTVVEPATEAATLAPLPPGKLHGCGPRAAGVLREAGILTVAQLAATPASRLEALLGSQGAWLWQVAHGRDGRPVDGERRARKSRGNESTFAVDCRRATEVAAKAHGLLRELLADQERDGRPFTTLTVKVRYADFRTVTRAATTVQPLSPGRSGHAQTAATLMEAQLAPLLRSVGRAGPGGAVRLVGVRLHNFVADTGQRLLPDFTASGTWPRAPGPAASAWGKTLGLARGPALSWAPLDLFVPACGPGSA